MVDLEVDANLILRTGNGNQQTLDEIRALQRDLPKLVLLATGDSMLTTSWIDLGSSAPRLFIVLPSNLHSWQEDSAKHTFRLHFLCHVGDARDGRHIHLSNHQGYGLLQPQEFFQKYGYYVLTMLTMTKYGLSDSMNDWPALDTLKIFWGYDSRDMGSISPENIGPLIDMAIAYLQDLSPLKEKDENMLPQETKELTQ